MKSKYKKITLSLAISLLSGYVFWKILQPVEIIAVHKDENYTSVLVKNFPLTDRWKMQWWLHNNDYLKKNYDIPEPASYGSYTIVFWDFGEGYKEEEKYDRLCFADIPSAKNCIDKKKVMTIYRYNNEKPLFSFNGRRYLINDNSDIIQLKKNK